MLLSGVNGSVLLVGVDMWSVIFGYICSYTVVLLCHIAFLVFLIFL